MRRLTDIKWRAVAGATVVVVALGGSIALFLPTLVAPGEKDDQDLSLIHI